MLFLLELDVCIMTLFMLQENYGIQLTKQEPEQDCRGAHQREWDLDLLRY